MPKHYERVYVDDLENDEALKLCEDASKFFWVRLFLYTGCKSPVLGKLLTKAGTRPELDDLTKMFGESRAKIARMLADLERNQVFSRDESGVIFCRRQVRAAEISEKRKSAAEQGWASRGVEQSVEFLHSKQPCKVDANSKANTHANAGIGNITESLSTSEIGQEKEGIQGEDSPLLHVVSEFNRGVAEAKVRPGAEQAARPSGRTRARDAKLLLATKTFADPLEWYWCGRAIGASAGHNGTATGFRASLPWLLERGKGTKLEEWMHRGAEMCAGRAPPSRNVVIKPRPLSREEELMQIALDEQQRELDFEDERQRAPPCEADSGVWIDSPKKSAGYVARGSA